MLVGGGRDTVAIVGFFPSTVRIRGGDTITWQHNSDEPHSVSFFPEGERLVAHELIPIPGHRRFDGHKAAVVVDTDSQLITAVDILPGNAGDNTGVLELVEQSEENTGTEEPANSPARPNILCVLVGLIHHSCCACFRSPSSKSLQLCL